ncbi:MAG: hypothetical protein KDH94_07575, partial [Coxiellaceae bacterium]|nr:hypothetical protein [Coxiellaceae bacterium]
MRDVDETLQTLELWHNQYASHYSQMNPARWLSLQQKIETCIVPLIEAGNSAAPFKILSLGSGSAAELYVLLKLRLEGKIKPFRYIGVEANRAEHHELCLVYVDLAAQLACTVGFYYQDAMLFQPEANSFDLVIFRHPLPANYHEGTYGGVSCDYWPDNDWEDQQSVFTKMTHKLSEWIKPDGHVFLSCYRDWEFERMHTLLSRISFPERIHYQDFSTTQDINRVDPFGSHYYQDGYFSVFKIDREKLSRRTSEVPERPQFI